MSGHIECEGHVVEISQGYARCEGHICVTASME